EGSQGFAQPVTTAIVNGQNLNRRALIGKIGGHVTKKCGQTVRFVERRDDDGERAHRSCSWTGLAAEDVWRDSSGDSSMRSESALCIACASAWSGSIARTLANSLVAYSSIYCCAYTRARS